MKPLKLNLSSCESGISSIAGKRKHDRLSPTSTISEQHKRYLYDTTKLLQQNKYYIPADTQNTHDMNDEPSQDTEAAKIKVPPIYIHNASNYKTVTDDIKTIIGTENFTVQCKTNSMRINLFNSTDFRKLTAFYDEKEIQYHTFQNPDNALLSVVIRNIPISVTEEEIKSELSKQFCIKRVTRLLNKDKMPIPLCVVDLEHNDKSDEIFNLTRFDHSIIAVEPRRKSRDIPQCTRCQRYGHTKNYCKLEARCVKCMENHHYSNCKKKLGEIPLCVNCGGNHTANYRGCPFYTDLKAKIISNQRHHTNPKVTHTNDLSSTQHSNEHPRLRHNTTPPRNSFPRSYANAVRNDQDSMSNVLKTLLDFISPYLDQIKQFIFSLFTSMFSTNVQRD